MSVQRRNFPAVARELGLHETVLRGWMMQCAVRASPPWPADLAEEEARLRRENGQLRRERDTLKAGGEADAGVVDLSNGPDAFIKPAATRQKPRSSSERPPDEVRVRR